MNLEPGHPNPKRIPDRRDGGRRVAALLAPHRLSDPVVLAVPPGGAVVGAEVARALGAPLEALVVRKLTSHLQPDLELGALAEGGAIHLDVDAFRALALTPADLEEIGERDGAELLRRVRRFRGRRPLPELRGRTVIVVDDGSSTASMARADLAAARLREPRRLVYAAPLLTAAVELQLRDQVDELVFLAEPIPFGSVGPCYELFPRVSDAEVLALLGAGGRSADREARAAT